MGRDIKYRAWDEKLNKFIYLELLPDKLILPRLDGSYDWQQSTGLKDKNGVEIYEGDIIRIWSTYGHDPISPTGLIKAVQWHATRPSFNIYRGSHLEVIGNVYESPNLLLGRNE